MSDPVAQEVQRGAVPLAPETASASPGAAQPHWVGRVARWLAHPPLPVTLIVCAGILIARKPDAVLHPQFWAEDGVEFYRDGLVSGWSVLFKPYVDYLHLIPRLVGAVAGRLDPAAAPAVFLGVALGLTLYVAGLTQSKRMPFRPHAGFALAVALVPDSAETLLNICNLQWVLAGALVLILIARDPESRLQRWHDGAAATLLGLTGPFSVVLAPLFWWRAQRRRTRASAALAAIITGCAAVQAWQILRAGALVHPGSSPISAIWRVLGMRVTGSLAVGAWVPPDYPPAVEVALGVIALVGAAALAWHRGEDRFERTLAAAAFVLTAAAAIFRVKHVLVVMCNTGNASRYFYLPQLLMAWLLLMAAGSRRRAICWSAAMLVVWLTVVNLPRLFNYPPVPDQHWERYVAPLRSGQAMDIPVNPTGWILRVPARAVGSHAPAR